MKESGILLHISSLPGKYGIGDLGHEAYAFVDCLKENGHRFWQVLPLNHCGYGNSPYNPISAFAFEKYLISPDLLYQEGFISQKELQEAELPPNSHVDYEAVIKSKDRLFEQAAKEILKKRDVVSYIEANAWYLKPYMAFCQLSEIYGDSKWYSWRGEDRSYSEALYDRLFMEHSFAMQKTAALQMIFEEQLGALKQYLASQGIAFIGDVPIYLSYESAEVWAQQELFNLDSEGRRKSVAGVPPDAFSESGQLWGNPIYLWSKLQESGFELFIKRFGHILKYLDLLRLDHFIGYVNYWEIPCPNSEMPDNAIGGSWVRALPEAFFTTLAQHFPLDVFIAEDLGILNQDVCHIRDSFGFPGMIILQFCFEDSVPEVQLYPPERYIYTGTHDNNTTKGWWQNLPENSPSHLNMAIFCKRYLPDYGLPHSENIHEIMLDIARISGCMRYVVPMQDILGLDDAARMNIPGTALGNWQWRMEKPI